MAIYIEIFKISENESLVEYKFKNVFTFGTVIHDKASGDTELIEISDEKRTNFCFDRVEYMLRKCYRNNQYPDNIDFMT